MFFLSGKAGVLTPAKITVTKGASVGLNFMNEMSEGQGLAIPAFEFRADALQLGSVGGGVFVARDAGTFDMFVQSPDGASTARGELVVLDAAPTSVFKYEMKDGKGEEFSFAPGVITVTKGSLVEIVFKNKGLLAHEWVIPAYGVEIESIAAATEGSIKFIADLAGTFEMICHLPSHYESGMVGRFIVLETAPPVVALDVDGGDFYVNASQSS
jgi:uncharacterized cupredoxin-like copper-binding protein